MRMKEWICVIAIVALVAGCGGSQRKANRTEAKVNNERLDLVEDYKKCMEDAGDDEVAWEACDSYLKAAEALH